MVWKKFERVRLGSPIDGIFKVFRLIRGAGKEHFDTSSCTDVNEELRQSNSLNTQAYLKATQRKHEIEGQKAMLILLSRHETWKVGGPV